MEQGKVSFAVNVETDRLHSGFQEQVLNDYMIGHSDPPAWLVNGRLP